MPVFYPKKLHETNGHSRNGMAPPTPEINRCTARQTLLIDGLDGLDGTDGLYGVEGAIGADRFKRPNGSNWWRTEEAHLLGKVFCYLADYVILPEASLLVISAWVLASYLAEF